MATLLIVYGPGSQTRRCDAQCYNARSRICGCVCGGANHGVGLSKAIRNTKLYGECYLEEYLEEHLAESGLEGIFFYHQVATRIGI